MNDDFNKKFKKLLKTKYSKKLTLFISFLILQLIISLKKINRLTLFILTDCFNYTRTHLNVFKIKTTNYR